MAVFSARQMTDDLTLEARCLRSQTGLRHYDIFLEAEPKMLGASRLSLGLGYHLGIHFWIFIIARCCEFRRCQQSSVMLLDLYSRASLIICVYIQNNLSLERETS